MEESVALKAEEEDGAPDWGLKPAFSFLVALVPRDWKSCSPWLKPGASTEESSALADALEAG